MYNYVLTIIQSGDFELADIIQRIDVLYASGRLTTDERSQLIEAAQDAADPMGGLPDYGARITDLEMKVGTLEERATALEKGSTTDPGTDPEPEPDPEPEDEYPAWHTPTGAHDAYYTGMKMTFTDGKRYECIAPAGYGCTYGPDVLPQYWKLVEDDA